MKQNLKDNSSRRKFLSLGLLSGAGLLTSKAEAMIPAEEDPETIPMLTPDGKLVQVSKKAMEQSADRQKVSNKDILEWSQTAKKA